MLTEAPTALKQHLSMHIATLSTYQSVREVVVSYLQAKQVWKPSAAYAGNAARIGRDPDAVDISHVGDGKGKGKGKEGKGKDAKKGKGKDGKGKSKEQPSKQGKGSEKDQCAICWKTSHAIEKCWFNSKGQPKGKGKKGVSGITDTDNQSVVSAGPSASQVGGQSVITLPSSVSTPKGKNVGMIGEHRLLRVKAGNSGMHRVSPKAILAIPDSTFMTPGPQHPDFTFRNEGSNTWDCKEFRKKWKLLQEPHETFTGSKVWALQVCQCGQSQQQRRFAGGHRSLFISMQA